jgi:hypothetical protein
LLRCEQVQRQRQRQRQTRQQRWKSAEVKGSRGDEVEVMS